MQLPLWIIDLREEIKEKDPGLKRQVEALIHALEDACDTAELMVGADLYADEAVDQLEAMKKRLNDPKGLKIQSKLKKKKSSKV